MAKMGNKFVAMCSVAVGLIYAGAYAETATQASPAYASSGNGLTTGLTNSTTAAGTSSSSTSDNASNATTTSAPPATPSSIYKDGTYTGSGYDRRGEVDVAVTISKGKITDVQIVGYNMHYSEGYINPVLLQEVVQQQTANVDIVSGATSSSEDFQAAVQQALDAAQNAQSGN